MGQVKQAASLLWPDTLLKVPFGHCIAIGVVLPAGQ